MDHVRKQPSRRKTTVWNLVFNYGTFSLTIVRNLVLVPIYLKYIDLELYGAWLATGAALVQMIVSEFGFLGVIVQRTGAAFGARDYRRLESVIGTSRVVVGLLALTVSGIGAAVTPILPRIMHLDGEAASTLMYCFLLIVVANGFDLLGNASGEMLKSLHRPFVPGLSRLAGELLGIVVTVVLLVQGYGLYGLAVGLLSRALLFSASTAVGLAYDCRHRLQLKIGWSRPMFKSLWKDSVHQFFAALAMRLQVYIDPFLVGAVLGGEAAAVYGLTYRALDTVRLAINQLGNAIAPSLAHLYGSGDKALFRNVFDKISSYYALVGTIAMGGILIFNRSFVGLWVGSDLYGGNLLTAAIAIFGVLAIMVNAPYLITTVRGEFRTIAQVLWVSLFVHVPLSYVLLHFGLWGAPVAASFGALLRIYLLGAITFTFFRFTNTDRYDLAKNIFRIFVPCAVIAGVGYVLVNTPERWLVFSLQAAAYIVISMTAFVIFNRKLVSRFIEDMKKTAAAR